jgi:glutathione peroxidase
MTHHPFLEAVRIWAAAAWADGELSPAEAQVVRRLIEVGPLGPDDRAAAQRWLHTRVHLGQVDLGPLGADARGDIYASAVRVAAAGDGVVRAEREFLSRLQATLGIAEADAAAIRDRVLAVPAEAPPFAALFDLPTHTLAGELTTLGAHRGKAMLVVNVASECGLTPQYEALQKLHQQYQRRGLTVIGFPCNQFGAQEPGTPEQIEAFCSATFGVTFPMMEKIDVKGDDRHDIYSVLSKVPDADGQAGDVMWNFEKFVVSADASRVLRFRPQTQPDDPAVIAAIEAALPE